MCSPIVLLDGPLNPSLKDLRDGIRRNLLFNFLIPITTDKYFTLPLRNLLKLPTIEYQDQKRQLNSQSVTGLAPLIRLVNARSETGLALLIRLVNAWSETGLAPLIRQVNARSETGLAPLIR